MLDFKSIKHIPLTVKLNYQYIPKRNLNSTFLIQRLHNKNHTLWYLPIKVGKYSYFLCSINTDQTITFYNYSKLYDNLNYFQNLFSERYVDTLINSQMKLRNFNTLLSENSFNIPISQLTSRKQLKDWLEKFLVNKVYTFFQTIEQNPASYYEALSLHNDICYLTEKEQQYVNSFIQSVFDSL